MYLSGASFFSQPISKDIIASLSLKSFDGGISEDRLASWLLLMDVLPYDQSKWFQKISQIKENYMRCINDFGLYKWHKTPDSDDFDFNSYGIEKPKVMSAIHVDLIRTGRQIYFLSPLQIQGDLPKSDSDTLYMYREHIRRMERILKWYSFFCSKI